MEDQVLILITRVPHLFPFFWMGIDPFFDKSSEVGVSWLNRRGPCYMKKFLLADVFWGSYCFLINLWTDHQMPTCEMLPREWNRSSNWRLSLLIIKMLFISVYFAVNWMECCLFRHFFVTNQMGFLLVSWRFLANYFSKLYDHQSRSIFHFSIFIGRFYLWIISGFIVRMKKFIQWFFSETRPNYGKKIIFWTVYAIWPLLLCPWMPAFSELFFLDDLLNKKELFLSNSFNSRPLRVTQKDGQTGKRKETLVGKNISSNLKTVG